MTYRNLLARSLVHYRAVHGAVALGVAAGAAVLAGSLIVGSSVRASLRDLTLDRLGSIDFAVVGERYFRDAAADALGDGFEASGGILISGTAEHADSGSRASSVRIHAVDESFWELFGTDPPEIGNRDILVNQRLAEELGAMAGDSVLLRFHADTLVPADSVMGRKADNVRLLRLQIAEVLENRGPGRFGLSAQQQLPYNAYVSKAVLERVLGQPGRANALFVSGGTLDEAQSAWRESFAPEDARLGVRILPEGRGAVLESERIVLDPASVESAAEAAQETGFDGSEVLTYLANSIESGERSVPYSTVTALASLPPSLVLASGRQPPEIGPDEILLNAWTADDLDVRPGAQVTLRYYTVGADSRLETASHTFTLSSIVRMAGSALDRDYAPVYRGMSDQTRMANWDPPFPMDLRLIRPRDETYWDRYRASPKGFVSLETAKSLWTSRFGQLTSLRLTPRNGADLGVGLEAFRASLSRRVDPASYGLSLQPVRESGLSASTGATDFSGLFIGFSMFLIAAAAILVALLFRLGVELRAREIGTMLAEGHLPQTVRRLLLAEGTVLAAIGCLVGIPGAVLFARLMVYGLNTWWTGAVGTSHLAVHVRPEDLLFGASFTLVLMVGSVWLSLRRLAKLSTHALLEGTVDPPAFPEVRIRRARRLRAIGGAAVACAILLAALSWNAEASGRLAAFFGAGTMTLVAALVLFRAVLLAPSRSGAALDGVDQLAMRNSGRNPTRSMLAAALVACASFMIVTVAMNRQDVSAKEPSLDSGDGGFRYIAESEAPLFAARIEETATSQPQPTRILPMRVRRGEDASCLNLYRPTRPTLAAVPPSLIERGGFAFQSSLAETEAEQANPWLLLNKDFDGAIPVLGDANSAMWILHLTLGQELTVEDGAGRQRRLVLAGMLSRSVFQSELLLAEDRFLDLYPDHSGYQTLLVETDRADLATSLEDEFAEEGLDATRSSDRIAGFLVVENTYLDTFRTLGGLGLLLGTLGLAVVMVRSVLERKGELALLEALGLGRGKLARLVLAENAFLLVFGVVVGSLAAVIAVAPHIASDASDPPWGAVLLTLAAVLATGLLAGVAAVGLSLRSPLLPALRRD